MEYSETSYQLAIAGPFDMNRSIIEIKPEDSVSWIVEDSFSPSAINEQFAKAIKDTKDPE